MVVPLKPNLTLPLNSLGYGVVGLNLALALERAGHEPALWPIGQPEFEPAQRQPLSNMVGRQASYDPSAPSVRVWHQFDLAQHVGKGVHAGFPFFELTEFRPAEVHHLKSQDLVIASSAWAKSVLEQAGVPAGRIRVVRPGVDAGVFRADEYDLKPAVEKTVVGNPTVFLNVGKWELRKGHDVLLEAFNRAFEPDDNVLLIMQCFNPCFPTEAECRRYNDSWATAYRTSKMGRKIDVRQGRLASHRDVAALMSTADCGVFPSRGEGWNLELVEMMALGKPVVCTHYSAHTEFDGDGAARLVHPDGLEDAHDGVWFKADTWGGRPGQWARLGDGAVDQLVGHLRDVHRLKQSGGLEPNLVGYERVKSMTWDASAQELVSALS